MQGLDEIQLWRPDEDQLAGGEVPDHCSMFLAFRSWWAMDDCLAKIDRQWIQGISKPGNPKRYLALH